MYNLDPLSPVKDAIVCTLLSAGVGGGWGGGGLGWAEPPTKFSKRELSLTRPQLLEGSFWERGGDL